MRQNKRLVFLSVVGIILVAAAFYYYVIFDLQQANTELEDDISFEEQREAALSESLDEQEDQENVNVDTLREALPASFNEDDVIRLLNRSSETTSTTVETINFTEEESVPANEWFNDVSSDETVQVLSMDLSGTSESHPQFEQFINQIEESARLTQLSNLEFQQNVTELTFQVRMTVFAFPLEDE